MDSENVKIENCEAMVKLLTDLYKAERKKNIRYMIATYVLIGLLFVSIVFSCYLLNELNSYEQITITTTSTTETFNNEIEGDDANVVNGNQYNDSATHNENIGEGN